MSGRRTLLRGPSLTLVIMLVVGGVLAVPLPAAAAPASVQLRVASDGTAPFDTLDATAANGIVRTNDTLTYEWNYSAPSGESVTFVHTLSTSPLIRFEASNTAQCTGAGAGSISADGHTLTCSVLADPTGSGSVPITVKPSGAVPNGTVISSAMTADGLSGGSTTTIVVGQPQLSLAANLWGASTSASVNGAAGNGFIYSFVVSQAAGAKGTELVGAPLTFTADLSTLTPNATVVPGSCGPNNRGGSAVPYGKVGLISGATATNSVADSGTITCSLTGQVLTVTITGANLEGATNPTTGAQGNTLPARTYLVSGIVTVFVPSTDIGASSINRTLQYKGFDPTSATGQSNFGTGYETGSEPTAAACTYVSDNVTRGNDNCFSTTFSPRSAGWGSYFVVGDTSISAAPAGAATTGTAGDGVASPGELFYDRMTIYSTSGPSLTNPGVCSKWNSAELHVVGVGRAWKGAGQLAASSYTVEYASLPMATDALRRSTSCATGTWYPSVEAAGGPSAVNAVRFLYTGGTLANGEFLLFIPQMQVQPVAAGTVVATFSSARLSEGENWNASYYVRETNVPNYTGNRMTVSDGRLRVAQSNTAGVTQSVQAGATYTYTVSPTVTRNTTSTGAVPGVTVTDTLPACARYVPDSASIPVELVAANNGTDGIPCTGDSGETGPKLLFKLGPIVPGTAIPAITFRVTILRIAADNTAATNSAVISSDAAVAIDLTKRTTAADITVRNQTQFAVAETTTTPQISGDGSVVFVVAYRNLSGLTVPRLTVVTELPYSGDANGSAFAGTLSFANVTKPANAAVECTGDAHGTISTDPTSTANTYGSTCDSSTTAVRITVTNLTNTSVDRVAITLTATGSATGNKYLSTINSAYLPNGSSTAVTVPGGDKTQVTVVSSGISGRAWYDVDNDGVRLAVESAAASLPVALTGTDDLGAAVSRTTSTAADGTYSFTGLRAGTYVVTFTNGSPPAGATFAPKRAGSDRSVDSDVNPATGATDSIVLGTGAQIAAIDAGIRYAPPAVSLAASAASVVFTGPVTLTATVPAAVTGTITFTADVGSGPQAGTTVTLGTASITNGSAAWTGPLPAYGATVTRAVYGGSGTYPGATSSPVPVENAAGASDLVITQFRMSGPGGAADQFVQILNRCAFPVPLGGVVVRAADGTAVTLPASAGTLPAGRSFLVAGGGYSLTGTAIPDLTVGSLGGPGGLRVSVPDTAGTVLDAVGTAAGYTSGTPLPAFTGSPAEQYAWLRFAPLGTPRDTGDNAADFVLVSTTGGVVGGVQSTVGSPAPASRTSPVGGSTTFVSSLVDPSTAYTAEPNRVVVNGAPGALVVRRVITNTGPTTAATMRLRVNSLSEQHGAPRPDGPAPANAAWLRLVAPSTSTTTLTIGGQPVVVQNLTPAGPAGGAGAGLNSTYDVTLPAGGLAPGASVAVALSFAVDRRGPFWFTYDVES
jgi:hypothetical protein